MTQDCLGLIISYAFVFAAIFAAEGLRKWRNLSIDFTRKFIHIAVGMWSVGTVLLFKHWLFAIIPPLSFVVINYISYRREKASTRVATRATTRPWSRLVRKPSGGKRNKARKVDSQLKRNMDREPSMVRLVP